MNNHKAPPQSKDKLAKANRQRSMVNGADPSTKIIAHGTRNVDPTTRKFEAYYDDAAKDYLVREENRNF
ncbi:MAG TPA: hypothetical protein VGM62_18985, partial [Chthoniobacterales bacterium]